jgi:hypothetical protein
MFDVTDERFRVLPPPDPVFASASKLWAERVNPIWWQTRTPAADWLTDDRRSERATDGHWLGQVHRSANLRHVFLAVWHDGTCAGFQNDIGWHSSTGRSRTGQPRALASLPLSLAS